MIVTILYVLAVIFTGWTLSFMALMIAVALDMVLSWD